MSDQISEDRPGNNLNNEQMTTALRSRLRRPVPLYTIFKEKTIEYMLMSCGAFSTLVILLIFVFLYKEGLVALGMTNPTDFLYAESNIMEYDPATETTKVVGSEVGYNWQPEGEDPKLSLIPLIWGSLGIAILTAILSTLAGISIGIFLSEMSSDRTRNLIKPALELLVGIPTVVVGFFMLTVIALPLKALATRVENFLGISTIYVDSYNMFIGALGVSVVIIPVIASLVDDALRTVPDDLRAASLSLGSTRWQTTWKVVLPAGLSGVIAAVILGFGRALGETMIVLMCAGNAPQMLPEDGSIWSIPFVAVRTMTASIAAEMGSAASGSLHAHSLFFVGAILVTITFLLNLTVEVIVNRYRKKIRL